MTRLEQWVRARPLKVAEQARTIGIPRVSLYRYMAGAVMPRPHIARKIEAATGGEVTAADLTADYRG